MRDPKPTRLERRDCPGVTRLPKALGISVVLALLLLLGASSGVAAPSSDNFSISTSRIGSSGGEGQSESYVVQGIAGSLPAGESSSPSYRILPLLRVPEPRSALLQSTSALLLSALAVRRRPRAFRQ